MNLIDRYIFVATERLPEKTRDDISQELRANIEDMLPENATEAQIREVLEKLGNPRKMAAEYSQSKRYLIGPDLYDTYLFVLKLVIAITSSVFGLIALLEGVLIPDIESTTFKMSINVFVNMLVAVVEGAMQGAIGVTLVFIIIERSGINDGKIPFIKKKWSPDDLLKLQIDSKRRISRGETIFSMICTVIFASMLYVRPQIFGWYIKGENGSLILAEPFFYIDRLQSYIPILITFTIILLCILIWKFIIKEWILPLTIINLIYNCAVCILVGVMVSDISIINQEFLLKLANLFEITLSSMVTIWQRGSWGFYAFFVIFSVWDCVAPFVKLRR